MEDKDSVKSLNYQKSKQDNMDDHMDDESKDRSTKDTETNASAKPLEISESPVNIKKHITGDVANAITEQTNVRYEIYTITDKTNTSEITQEDIGEETDKKEMKIEPLEDKGAILSINQSITSQPICSKD